MAAIEDAILLAVTAHKGQVDKGGAPYIFHPLRLMLQMDDDNERMAAVLHDVVEDTEVTLDDIREAGFPDAVIEAVDLLTHGENVPYEDYINRLRPNPVARKVKMADLVDNMDVRRLTVVDEKARKRAKKYKAVLESLRSGASLNLS
ncbi:MAG: HD domain-containing protein [Acidobacteria bacterium]|nr:MAG: HD domain-containing protein [Acidobacteriota bacterium]